ncbi:hypothetical protein RJ639_002693 [Escallonia herrerae]|uniref:Transposase (putative) gypsy type domain-containing protein n=1 Tax=Escallonia herrerae TaxID=1293975 RepID=A0AA88XBZ2_9ASTE|nr:hypothetical protein RJ639_002693 [Escallonia herrerae]
MVLLRHGSVRTEFCSDGILFWHESVRHLSLCSGRVFGLDYVRTKFCSAFVTLLGQSFRTGFYSDIILLGRCHSARAECSDGILFGQNSTRPLSLCLGRVFRRDYVRPEFCSDEIMFGQNSARPLSLYSGRVFRRDSGRTEFCSGRVFGHDSVRARFCSAVVILYAQSVRTRSYSGRILFGHDHSVRAECSDTILLGHDSVRTRSLSLVFHSFLVWVENMSETSASVSSSEKSSSSSSLERVPTSRSEVGTSNPQLPLALTSHPFQPSTSQPLPPSSSQPSHSLSRKNAFGDVKDQADDKANPKPWYTADEKSGKMSTEDLQDLIREYPLPEGWYARLPGLQELANYGTKFEIGIYEEQVKSGYRLHLHPLALRFFEHYRMAPGQLVPNGWRKLAGLIYLVQTSGYKPEATYFIRGFFEIYFVKGVANCPGWYYIHSRQRLLKGGPKANKGWHSRYFFVGRLDKGELPFDRDWNPFCKDFENPDKPTPNNLSKHILSHIKLRVGLCIDEPFSEEQLEWAKIIPLKPIPAGLQIPSHPPAIPSMSSAETVPLELSNREEDYLAKIETLEKRLERIKRKAAEEVTKAQDQGIRDFLDGNAGDEWLKKRADDGLEIYELGFAKAKEMFGERFPDIPLDDFVLPAVISPSGETVLPSEAGDAAASHPPGEGPSGDAPEP